MAFRELRELMTYLANIHTDIASACEKVADPNGPRESVLATSFQDWEEALSKRLHTMCDEGVGSAMDMWVQFVPTDNVEAAIDSLKQAASESASAVVSECLHVHEEIVNLLTLVAEGVNSPNVSETLADLASVEDEALRKLQYSATVQHDM